MKTKSTWRFVMKIVGAALAAAGLICLLVAYWDKLTACGNAIVEKCKCKCGCSEFDDYDDELLYE